jgi:hypothetical protein
MLEQALEAIGAKRRAELCVEEADKKVNVVWKELESAATGSDHEYLRNRQPTGPIRWQEDKSLSDLAAGGRRIS